ncbi:DUF805 domain-containing protein (plasmid) [Methylobacterium sp. OT2]|nr:DUF805 domain-containing protein [Methylobacterium sp. OT2]
MRESFASRSVHPDTLVWRSGLKDWIKFSDAGIVDQGPPELPQSTPAPAANGYVNFQDAIAICLKKYAKFTGRASRSEYWYFLLFVGLAQIISSIIDGFVIGFDKDIGPFSFITSLVTFLPFLAVAVRRLHDTNRSGWMFLLALIPIAGPIILLVFFCQKSKNEGNTYT